ncbi:MAG TPA: peroxiredoxin [Gemmatimonadales bacterium]|nr:peroxiredoxin [Gemmatimonadales bacterium]
MTNLCPLRPALLLAALALPGAAAAQQGADPAPATLAVGDAAPAIDALDAYGKPWRSADIVGDRILVVYFYPAAMTEGCTKQACAFRDDHSTLQELGAEVVGVSGDRGLNLIAFRESNRLNFPLLPDTAGSIAKAFGVPLRQGGTITRTVDGRELQLTRDVTAARWTFIIDRQGRIAFKETEVNPEGDSKAVIAAIRKMQG